MQKIGIGNEDYKNFLDKNLYYVDKTLMIRDIINSGETVTLFTRPRRFGKTLTLSMLKTFFEEELDRDGNIMDNSRYFSGKKIMECGDENVLSMMGQYPVINLSLKSAGQSDFKASFKILRDEIADEFARHIYLKDSDRIDDVHKAKFDELLHGGERYNKANDEAKTDADRNRIFKEEVERYSTALKSLSECLMQHHGKKVIILIDEYDVPLENAWFHGFYDEMVGFIRTFFESALKTNSALDRAVITGCLRISRESIFTGLNNLMVNSIRTRDFGEYFGFTPEETIEMLSAYGLSDKVDEVRKWYDGYLFGDSEVYNPWSVTNYIKLHWKSPDTFPEPYWSNTSSNKIIKDLIDHSSPEQKADIDTLVTGGTIEKKIHEDITYADVHESDDNLWNFLFFTGYLRKVSERQEDENLFVRMCIPNIEVRYIYKNHITVWFDKKKKEISREPLYKAIIERDAEQIGAFMSGVLKQTISTFDSGESFYHGMFLSLLYGMPDYIPKSNREEGEGRPDIVLYPENPEDPAFIFELKVRKDFREIDAGIKEAIKQIDDRHYEDGIENEGYAGYVSFGACFCKKRAMFRLKKEHRA